jgi:hypothetical protein
MVYKNIIKKYGLTRPIKKPFPRSRTLPEEKRRSS